MALRKFAATTALLGCLGGLSACGKPDVFPLSMAEAYKRLNTVQIAPADNGVFYGLVTSVSGNSAAQVMWSASDSHASRACKLGLTKVDANLTGARLMRSWQMAPLLGAGPATAAEDVPVES